MNLGLVFKGAAMGIAEAIPGVSGGTIAFITGIYQELLETIKSFTPANFRLLLTNPKMFWEAINGNFLIRLIIGMVAGLGFGIIVIGNLLENHQSLLWAFFFGLVLASAIYLAKNLKWEIRKVLCAILGAVMAYGISSLAPSSGSENPLYLFLAGCIAISALMLPGLSGSFMLLLLGLYDQIINGLKAMLTDLDFSQILPLGIFSAGLLVGLFSFARILSFLFKRFPDQTMATMIGVLIGSLSKLWPWKLINTAYSKSTGAQIEVNSITLLHPDDMKILSETNLMPWEYAEFGDPKTSVIVVCFIVGIVTVGFLSKLSTSASE